MRMRNEIKIQILEGSRLIGTRTKGRTVIVSFEYNKEDAAVPEPEPIRPIGFAHYKEPAGKDKKIKLCSLIAKNMTPKNTTVGVR